jgi:hypothetical protein
MKARLRWKKEPEETGLRRIGAAPRGYDYHDGETVYAHVRPLGGGWQSSLRAWYWYSYEGVPYENTANNPIKTVEEAKLAASKFVKENLK